MNGDLLKTLGQNLTVTANRDLADHIRGHLGDLVESGADFHADDLRNRLDPWARLELKDRPNVLPAVIGAASCAKRIVPVGVSKPSRASRHGNRNLVWRAA